jgi:NNP family nitrate/nitrite transporter-like MFS transporter
MREPELPRASFADQSVIFRRPHNWIMCWLRTGALGSLLGYAAGFPLLLKTEFATAEPLAWAFLGPLAGALAGFLVTRAAGAARVTFAAFCLMAGASVGALHFLPQAGAGGSFAGFFGMSVLLFGAAGAASAATARMIPRILNDSGKDQGGKEGAAVLGFTSALAAFGAFFIPKSYGTSIALTGSPEFALWCFAGFYASCIAITWHCYMRHPDQPRLSRKPG